MSETVELVDGPHSIVFEARASVGWIFFDLTGWDGLTDDKMPITERPQGHGAFEVEESFRTSRAISFNVAWRNGDPTVVTAAVEFLSSIGAERPVLMIVTRDGVSTGRRVTIQAIPVLDVNGRFTGDMLVNALARDPRRYSLESATPWVSTGIASAGEGLTWDLTWPAVWPGGGTSGRITLSNTGMAPSAPQFRLHGAFSSALITCVETGDRIGLARPVPAGSTVVIDVATRLAKIDGQSDVSRWLRWREWTTIPRGESRTFQFEADDQVGATLDGRVLSAWW